MVAVRNALESLWKGLCTVTIREKQVNPITKRTEFVEAVFLDNQPCRLSFETLTSTDEANHAAVVGQATKLFLAPEISIPAGSKITVTQNGKTTDYSNSGEPAIHSNHQEIRLNLFEGWA